MGPTDTQDDFDAAQDRARRDHESREQAADDLCSAPKLRFTDRIRKAAQEIEQVLPDVHPVNGYAEGADADYAASALWAIDRCVEEIKDACREWEERTPDET